tara:strand:+ start:900 stop:1808 length:909 start_codon:yes stop_codon:yes gene_type:complete
MIAPRLCAVICAITFWTPAIAEVPRVVADTPVAQSLAAMVMGDLAVPDLLLDRGADPHDFQLRPSQARSLANADLVVWTSPSLSPWMVRPLDSLVAAQVIALEDVDGVRRQRFDMSSLLAGGNLADEIGGYDPHLWLDPRNAAPWLREIAARLAALDPENADRYAANAGAAIEEIDAITAEVAATLAPVRGAGLVMYHDAFGYFVTAFGLNVLGTVTMGDAVAPGVARISAVRAALAASDAVCLFPEVNQPRAPVEIVAEGLPLRIGAGLDPAGTMLEPGAGLYGEILRGLARQIVACVNGS